MWGVKRFLPEWAKKRSEIGVPLDAIMLISVGELNSNKNNGVIISALGSIKDKKLHYVLCGIGEKEEELRQLSKECGIADNVHFLGYRTDIRDLLNSSDIFVMPSKREGLSRSVMEAMACGLPCVVSRIRGNTDLIEDCVGGYLVEIQDVEGIADKIGVLSANRDLREKMKRVNLDNICKFSLDIVVDKISNIYANEFRG
jgi:glycosyltransferase involved in cell wall biosynthesis